MRVRPILFSGPMVRALIDGRKTQTRRVLKPQLECTSHAMWPDSPDTKPSIDDDGLHCGVCGAGIELAHHRKSGVRGIPLRFAPGDVLWVRETWGVHSGPGVLCCEEDEPNVKRKCGGWTPVIFRATTEGQAWGMYGPPQWRPSIHMPRRASRLTLEVTGVKVERLQDISEADAMAEGVCQFCEDSDRPGSWTGLSPDDRAGMVRAMYGSPARAYQHLWEIINGAGSWDANPWVVAVSFRVHQQNVDAYLAREREAA